MKVKTKTSLKYSNLDKKESEQLLHDVLSLFTHFICHSSQFISGIGCSCLKHLLFSVGTNLNSQMWKQIGFSLWQSTYLSNFFIINKTFLLIFRCLTLYPIRLLISQFFCDSNEFCGDMGQMSITIDNENKTEKINYNELQLMAKQVMLKKLLIFYIIYTYQNSIMCFKIKNFF